MQYLQSEWDITHSKKNCIYTAVYLNYYGVNADENGNQNTQCTSVKFARYYSMPQKKTHNSVAVTFKVELYVSLPAYYALVPQGYNLYLYVKPDCR